MAECGPPLPRYLDLRRHATTLLALGVLVCLGGCGTVGSRPASPVLVDIGAGLKGAPGLRASLYATGPETVAAFALDPQGRLWLTAAGLDTHAHDGVYEIPKPGGRAVEVISGLDDPLGIAWYRGELYVASVGRVDRLSGFDGSRFAKRQRILDGPVPGGENNLLLIGPDGRFLMGITASCDHCAPSSKWSGSIVSFRPDGSDLRLFATRIRAPFGLAFFPGTHDLFASMNQRDDLGDEPEVTGSRWCVRRSALGFPYARPGWSGLQRCAKSHCGAHSTPLSGAVVMESGRFATGSGTSALVSEWQSKKVVSVALTRTGSSYRGSVSSRRGSVSPFLGGIENPLALVLAPGGSLLVGDWATGKIYRVSSR